MIPRLAGRLATALTRYAHRHGAHHYLTPDRGVPHPLCGHITHHHKPPGGTP